MAIFERLKHAWNVFRSQDNHREVSSFAEGVSFSTRPDRVRYRWSNERSIIASIYTRMGIDVASAYIRHVRLDKEGRYAEDVDSGLNECLSLEANIDQGASHFRQDIVTTLFDRGVVAIVPVDTSLNPDTTGSFDIKTLRVGEITQWFPDKVKVLLYRESTGRREEVIVSKRYCAIVENPLYAVMNEPNSTLKRLIHKLNLLDAVDEQSSSGKLDIMIQLPYVVKSEARRKQAQQRRQMLEEQLSGSKYGIAYIDGTEKITQLNRPAENNLLKQVEYLTGMLYSELGLTVEVMNGTADEAAMINYWNRSIEPLLRAITEAMSRTFLTKTARTQGQSIIYLRDPFRLVPISQVAEIGDKFIRNEILAPNEIRAIIGFRPSKDAKADKLGNPNMPDKKPAPTSEPNKPPTEELGGDSQNGSN